MRTGGCHTHHCLSPFAPKWPCFHVGDRNERAAMTHGDIHGNSQRVSKVVVIDDVHELFFNIFFSLYFQIKMQYKIINTKNDNADLYLITKSSVFC